MKTSIYEAEGYQTNVYSNPNSAGSSQTLVTRYSNRTIVTNGQFNGGKDRVTPNPFRFDIVRGGWGSYYRHLRGVAYCGYSNQTITGPQMPPNYDQTSMQYTSPDWSLTDNTALGKIYDQLRGNSNLVVDLAESSATLRMFKSTLNLKKFIRGFLKDVVGHKKFKSVPKGTDQSQKRLDYVTQKWLEYRYGWQPLVYSIYDAADNLNRQLQNKTIYVKGRSGVKRETPSIVLSQNATDKYSLSNYFSSFRTEYGMLFRIPGGPKISDWTSLNPLGIAYELMTLSFVIDWVADVSGYLSLWENNALFSSNFIMGYRTRSYKEYYTYQYSRSASVPFVTDPGGCLQLGSSETTRASSYCVRVSKDRQRITTLPLPSSVTVKVKFGSLRQLDSIALFHQIIARKLRG